MTNQEAFSKVARHLLKQNARSMIDDHCAYRANNGLRCAVGCLLSDAEYDPVWDQRVISVTDLRIQFAPPSLAGLDGDLLSELQMLHDSEEPAQWRCLLERTAARFGLTMPEDV